MFNIEFRINTHKTTVWETFLTKSMLLISNFSLSTSGFDRKCNFVLPVYRNATLVPLYAPQNDRNDLENSNPVS